MDRVWLKNRAKGVLKKHYFILLIVSFVMMITSGHTGGVEQQYRYNGDYMYQNDFREFGDSVMDGFRDGGVLEYGANVIDRGLSGIPMGRLVGMFMGIGFGLLTLVFALAGTVFMFLVSFPLKVGGSRIYIDSADGEHAPLLSRFAYAFKSGYYGNILVAGLLRGIFTFLWSLLFVIPGIVKAYAYSMVPYILADNPGMRASEAIRLSQEMMRGHKMEKFILDISFFGWYLLGSLAFGIGVFFVQPYVDATEAQFYLQLRTGYVEPEPVVDTRPYPGGGYQN